MTTEEQQACATISREITLLLNALNSYKIGLSEDHPDDRKVMFRLWDLREAALTIARIGKDTQQ